MVTADMVRQAAKNIRGEGEYRRGWDANNEYRLDRETMLYEGSVLRAAAFMLSFLGFMLFSMMLLLIFTDGWASLKHPFVEQTMAIGLVAMLASILFWFMYSKRAKAAKIKFNEKWKS